MNHNPDEEEQVARLLRQIPLPNPSPDLQARILAMVPPARWWWPFGPLWRPVAALAFSWGLGLAMGSWWMPADPPWEGAAQVVYGLSWEDDHDP